MSDTKYQFESLRERCVIIKHNMPNAYNFPNGGKHADKILRLVKDIDEIAQDGFTSQCEGYEQDERSQEEYELMLQTCWKYMSVVEKEINEYCKILPENVVSNWFEKEMDFYNGKLAELTHQLDNAKQMSKIVRVLWQ